MFRRHSLLHYASPLCHPVSTAQTLFKNCASSTLNRHWTFKHPYVHAVKYGTRGNRHKRWPTNIIKTHAHTCVQITFSNILMCTGTYGARKRHIYKTMMLTLMWENMSIWTLLRTSSRSNLYRTRTNESASLTNPYFTSYSIPKPTENTVSTANLNVQMSPNSIRNRLDFRCGPLIPDDPDSSDMDHNKKNEKNTSQRL